MNNKINKTAYPQGHVDLYREDHDINKWIKTFQTISLYVRQGYKLKEVFEQLTKDWDDMEKNDFNHWMKYYQSSSHSAYKTAQFTPSPAPQYIEMGPGALLPNKITDTSAANDLMPKIKLPEENDPQFQINKKIKAIINRLSAAEKLATDPEVQRELSRRLDVSLHKWLEELQRVKRLVQVAPIKHAQSTILEDLLIKEANILAVKGFPKAAQELIKIAQASPPATLPALPSLPAPGGASPSPAPALPGASPGAPPAPGAPSPENSKPLREGEEALKSFVERMSPAKDKKDKNEIVDMADEDPLADIFISDGDMGISDDVLPDDFADEEFIVTAQEAPPTNLNQPAAPMQAPVGNVPPGGQAVLQPEIEVSEEPPVEEFANTKVHQKTDDLLEQALSGITVNDVIERLDTLVNLFRTREIPRQLAIIDLMMDQLNLSSFFPGLAEASSKSLEANQYALSRIEEVLSKLKGSIKNPKDRELDLTGVQSMPSSVPAEPVNLEGLRSNLQNQELKEKARRQQKKQEELNKAIPEPELEISEDLNQPISMAPEQGVPVEPIAPPAPTAPLPVR